MAQPPLDGAPGWLTVAVARWRAAESGASPVTAEWVGE
jgi:hypothetical protein